MKLNLLLSVIGISLLAGCSDANKSTVMTVDVKQSELNIVVPAKGEVIAANSTVMSVPGSARGPQTLAWILPENSVVKEGQVVARFDGETFTNKRDSTQLDLSSADLETTQKSRVIASEKADIKSDTVVVDKEIDFSEKFNIDDLTVYSKNEIIEALDNRLYLSAQKGFLSWKLDNFSVSSESEMELMSLKAQQYRTKLEQYETALTQLEVYAPHDGILIYEKNWRGEKPRVGQSMWPGSKLAKLPDLSLLQAQIYVLESEAGSVEVGNSVDIRLDTATDRVFKGVVEKKDNMAKTIKSGNPVKYFGVVVNIQAPDLAVVKPGNKLAANIIGANQQNVLTVPLQAVFSDDKGSFVYVAKGDKMTKQAVSLGMKTFAEVQIVEGLNVGDNVALFKPTSL